MTQTIDTNRPTLRYIEFHAWDGCNLNCKACSHFAPLFSDSSAPDLRSIEHSFERLSLFFSKVDQIRILGGEPLLNKELPNIFRSVRGLMPDSQISLVTNGLLLETWGEILVKAMVQYRIKLWITWYPANAHIVPRFARLYRDAGVDVQVSPFTDRFRLFLTQEKQKDSFTRCGFRNLTFLRDGKIYPCALSALVGRFNNAFDFGFPECDGIELDAVADGEDVLRKLSSGCGLCDYCNSQGRLITWGLAGVARSEDWLPEE